MGGGIFECFYSSKSWKSWVFSPRQHGHWVPKNSKRSKRTLASPSFRLYFLSSVLAWLCSAQVLKSLDERWRDSWFIMPPLLPWNIRLLIHHLPKSSSLSQIPKLYNNRHSTHDFQRSFDISFSSTLNYLFKYVCCVHWTLLQHWFF